MEQKASVLIVEDEVKIRAALRDFLEFRGFKVSEAVDGLEAERKKAAANSYAQNGGRMGCKLPLLC
jgi:DNA-binding response OmpR family regulator